MEARRTQIPGPGFTIRCFKYCAPYLYNTLSKTIRQLENIETFKKVIQFMIALLRKLTSDRSIFFNSK